MDCYREVGDLVHEGYCRHNLSIVYLPQGRLNEALEVERQALEGFQRAGHRRGEAMTLNGIGWMLGLGGEHEQALAYGQRALTVQIQDGQCEASILDTIARAHYHLGQYQPAQHYYRKVVDLCRQVGNRHDEAVALAHLGNTHDAADEPEMARDAWQRTLDIIETLDHLPSRSGKTGYKRLPDAESLLAKLQQLD
jgi:tetratricopeptide (TPR) repeat protein